MPAGKPGRKFQTAWERGRRVRLGLGSQHRIAIGLGQGLAQAIGGIADAAAPLAIERCLHHRRPHAAARASAMGLVEGRLDDPGALISASATPGRKGAQLCVLQRLGQTITLLAITFRHLALLAPAQELAGGESRPGGQDEGEVALPVFDHPGIEFGPRLFDPLVQVGQIGQQKFRLAASVDQHRGEGEVEPLKQQMQRRLDRLPHEKGAGAEDAARPTTASQAEQGFLNAGEIERSKAEFGFRAILHQIDVPGPVRLMPGGEAGGDRGDSTGVVVQRHVGLINGRGGDSPQQLR